MLRGAEPRPRGLALLRSSLVFDEKQPGNGTIMLAAGWTVLLSVIAHGVTANPLVGIMTARPATEAEESVWRRGLRSVTVVFRRNRA